MATESETHMASAEELSALVDGELHAGAVAGACGRWRNDAVARSTWYAYQLIGDVLRSEDLASDPGRDVAFLSALRGRLGSEPVVLAPEPAVAAPTARPRSEAVWRRRWSWAAPSAVAAGFVAVAGVLVVTRSPAPPSAPIVAGVGAASEMPRAVAVPRAAVVNSLTSAEPSRVATGQMIRDAGLDHYLVAHKHFAGSAALGVPSAFLRSATVDAAGR